MRALAYAAWCLVSFALFACGESVDPGRSNDTAGASGNAPGAGGDTGTAQGGGGAPDGLEQAISACTRTCSSGNALFALAESYQCEPGDRSQYGVLLHDGEDAEVPTLITDPTCVPYCEGLRVSGYEGLGASGYECWEEGVAIDNCNADAIWVCDIEGGWVSNDCTTVTGTDYCNE